MKLSSGEKTLFQKDLTRFAPFWGLYQLCLILGLLLLIGGDTRYLPEHLVTSIQIMSLVSCGYALLTSQLLFGDLYESRMVSGLHALPLRREQIYTVKILEGLAFSFGPNLGMALLSIPFLSSTHVVGAWKLAFLWLLAVQLQYLFFFGLGAFCALCAGNRLGQAALYGMASFGGFLVIFLIDSLYTPMLYGVVTPMDRFMRLCPLFYIPEHPSSELVEFVGPLYSYEPGYWTTPVELKLGSLWGYLWAIGAEGVLLMILGFILYRVRKLERAGDLVAVKTMEPVFLVGVSIMGASVMGLMRTAVSFLEGPAMGTLFVALGMGAGWILGQMLLKRTLHVFQWRNFLGLGALAAAVGVSLLMTWQDFAGIADWVPEPEQVQSARVTAYRYYGDEDMQEDPDVIADVIALQQQALEDRVPRQDVFDGSVTFASVAYQMKNGRTVIRDYYVPVDSPGGRTLAQLLSDPDLVLGREMLALDWNREGVRVWISGLGNQHMLTTGTDGEDPEIPVTDLMALKEAVLADCAAGHMAGESAFHPDPVLDLEVEKLYGISVFVEAPGDMARSFTVYADSEHCLAWMEKQGILAVLEQELEQMN